MILTENDFVFYDRTDDVEYVPLCVNLFFILQLNFLAWGEMGGRKWVANLKSFFSHSFGFCF